MIALCVLGGAFFSSASELAPTQQVGTFEKRIKIDVRYDYLISLPANYEKEKKWPLVLFLHGSGECGSDVQAVKKNGPPKYADEKPYPFILLSPQAPDEFWDVHALHALLNEIEDKYKVDPDRIYVTGLSLGGGGTWKLVAAYPDRFAAAAPVCGWNPKASTAPKIKHVPFWVFHGDKDRAVPLSHSKRMVDALLPLGAEVKFTIYPNVGHDCWIQAYAEPELWNWLLSHTRKKH